MTEPRRKAGKPRRRPVAPDGPDTRDDTAAVAPGAYPPAQYTPGEFHPATSAVAAPMADGPAAPSDEAIRARAYELYLARGGTPGHAIEDWLAAEQALRPAGDRERPTA